MRLNSLIFIFLLLLINSICYSQAKKVEKLTIEEGLTDNSAHYTDLIHRDTFGYIWISTYSGLNRYDGYEVTRFNKVSAKINDLPVKRLTTIEGDSMGNLWLGTDFNEIIFYDVKKETFTLINDIVSNTSIPDLGSINALRMDTLDNLVINSANNGVFYFNTTSKKFGRHKNIGKSIKVWPQPAYERQLDNGEFIYSGNSLIKYTKDSFEVLSNFENAYSTFDVVLPNNKIYYEINNSPLRGIYDTENGKETWYEKDEDVIAYFDPTKGYKFWNVRIHTPPIFINNKLHVGKTLQVEELPEYIADMELDYSGDIIYATAYIGAGKISDSENAFLNQELPITSVKKFQKNLYISTPDEIQRLDNDSFHILMKEEIDTVIFETSWNFCFDKENNLMINFRGSKHKTLLYRNAINLDSFESSLHDQMDLFQDGNVVVDSRQYTAIPNSKVKFIGEYFEDLSGLSFPDFRTRYHFQSRNNDIWMATLNGILIRIYDNYKKFEYIETDLAGNGKLRNSKIYYIYEAFGRVYFCNESGVDFYDVESGKFGKIEINTGTAPFYIKGMAHDDAGRIWLMDNRILFRYDTNDGSISKFYVPSEFKIDVNPCKDLVFHENKLFYKGSQGLVSIDINKLDASRKPLDVIFQNLFIDRVKIYPEDESTILDSSLLFQTNFQLNFKQRNVGFQFVSVDSKELNAEYHYRLVGLKDEWANIKEQRIIHFTNLSPGKYKFEVKVQSSSGKWSDESSVRSFRIIAPWYARWWAYLLYLTLIASIVYLIYSMKVNQIRKQEQLRVKISQDLHDDVGGLLTGLSMQSEILELSLDGKPKSIAGKVRLLGQEALGRMRDTVWSIDSSKDDVISLIDRMKDHAEMTLGAADMIIDFEVNVPNENQELPPNIRQQTYLIFKEAVTNAAKYSNGDQVNIRLEVVKRSIKMVIKDNGTVKKMNTSGLGLASMKKRAEAVEGDLEIDVNDGFGITFQVRW